jgi:hypothetical protein
MADKAVKPKAKAKRGSTGVLGTLPASRPERIGRPRGGAPKRAPAKPRAKRRPKPTPVASNGAAKTTPKRARMTPQAVRPGSPPLHVRRALADAPPPVRLAAPTGTELVTTSIRAAGELAQIGFTLGGLAIKRAVDRIPRP